MEKTMEKKFLRMPIVVFGQYMLRTIKKSDYLDLYHYGVDKDVTKYLTWGPFENEKEAKQAISKVFYPRLKKGLPIGYAIIDLEQDKMIGTIDFHTLIKEENGAEIGFALHKDYWNQGIMSQALKIMITIGFDYLNYDIIYAKHLSKNLASQRVIEKAGFHFTSTEVIRKLKSTGVIDDKVFVYTLRKDQDYGNQQS
jgi:[ribosomal protein S5]-alanine N-acetyltransferase